MDFRGFSSINLNRLSRLEDVAICFSINAQRVPSVIHVQSVLVYQSLRTDVVALVRHSGPRSTRGSSGKPDRARAKERIALEPSKSSWGVEARTRPTSSRSPRKRQSRGGENNILQNQIAATCDLGEYERVV